MLTLSTSNDFLEFSDFLSTNYKQFVIQKRFKIL